MLNRKYLNAPSRVGWMLLLTLAALPACSTFSMVVRHSDPLSSEQHVQLGASYESQGLMMEASQQYDAALRLNHNDIPALIARGNIAYSCGDLKTAERSFRRVLRHEPNHAGANNNLAMVLLSRGKDLKQAERYALVALKQGGPLRIYVLETLAEIYLQESKFSAAWKVLKEADEVAPSDNTALCEQLSKTRNNLVMIQK